jgi:hypothetical protein
LNFEASTPNIGKHGEAMLEKSAKTFRDIFLVLAIAVFVVGVIDVIMLAFDLSLRTQIMLTTGMKPHSFVEAAGFLALASIAFGMVELGRTLKR